MPVLSKLIISDFRNIAFGEVEFSRNVNCICGNNGEGKTNLLDAIYYLSMTKSAFSSSDRYNFRHGKDSFTLCGTYSMPDGVSTRISVQVGQKDKLLKSDDKVCRKLSSHIGRFPVVMVSPSDISLVSESGEDRRRFVNSVLSQLSPEYLSSLQQYNKLLMQRNHMLKQPGIDMSLLDVMDERLSALSEPVYRMRSEFVRELSPAVASYYNALSGGSESVSISYVSDLGKGNLKDILLAGREKDFLFKYTTSGVQRDDFKFEMDSHPIRSCGSQGQQKSFLVALKFAQYDIMKESCGFPPMLLLDDVFDKLDLGRISNLISMVSSSDFGQIFITDTNRQRLQGLVDGFTAERAYFTASGGSFSRI